MSERDLVQELKANIKDLQDEKADDHQAHEAVNSEAR